MCQPHTLVIIPCEHSELVLPLLVDLLTHKTNLPSCHQVKRKEEVFRLMRQYEILYTYSPSYDISGYFLTSPLFESDNSLKQAV